MSDDTTKPAVGLPVERRVGRPEPARDDCDDECSVDGELLCLICGGEGIVEGRDHLDWDEDGYDDLIECTSCRGSGLAKDMTWC